MYIENGYLLCMWPVMRNTTKEAHKLKSVNRHWPCAICWATVTFFILHWRRTRRRGWRHIPIQTHTHIWKHKLLSFLITYSGDNLNRTCANTFTFIHSLSLIVSVPSGTEYTSQPAHPSYPTKHSFIYYFTSIHRNKIICINNIGCGFPLFGQLASIHLMEIVNIWANERMSQWNVRNEHICQQISMEQKIVVHIPSSLYKCPLNPTRAGSLVPWPSSAVVAVVVACWPHFCF